MKRILGYIPLPPSSTDAEHPMATLISTLFWDKKLKIAILTLATFAALC